MTRNKLKFIDTKNEENEIFIERLDKLTLQQSSLNFNKQQNEIVIMEDEILNYTDILYRTYQISNINNNQLIFLYPYIKLSTESGNNFDSDWVEFSSWYWWEQINDNSFIFKLRVRGYLYTSISPTVYVPYLYLTIKIKILNPNLSISLR